MPIVKTHFFYSLFLIFLSFDQLVYGVDDCLQCEKLRSETIQFKSQLSNTSQELERERAKIKELAETSLPKKMQTTSTIFVLVAKIETLQNDIKGNELDLKKLKCAGCNQKPRTNTLPQSKSSSSLH